jgi:SNF2 family DNA or RNA helicase
LDEAHNIKNKRCQTTQGIYSLHSLRRIALTGTPIQNTLNDLKSIFTFLGFVEGRFSF